VSFTVTNNNNSLFATQPTISPDGTLTYAPAANANGSATVSVVLRDNGGTDQNGQDTSPAQTFLISVTAVNDAPSFTKGVNQTVNEDAAAQSIGGWASGISAGPSDESGQTVTFSVSDNNPSLFSVAPAVTSNGTLTYTVAPDANGSATVSVTAIDNGGTANGGSATSAPQTFTITVNAVNDAPTFSLAASPAAINEDSGAQAIDNFATNFQPGPATATDEAGQTLVGYTVTVTDATGGLGFSSAPTINNAGQLAYTVAANTSGTATLSVTATDSGSGTAPNVNTSAPRTFTITVNPVNDAPSFTPGANQSANGEHGPQSVPGWATAIVAGPADESSQTVTFTVTSNDPALFTAQPTVAPNGTLTYTPANTKAGTATVSVSLKDNGGIALGGQDTSAVRTFTITIIDTTPPVFSNVPATIIEEATAANGAAVTYTAPTANDTVSGNVAVSCAPASGSTFALGTTTVACSAKDDSNNEKIATFEVTVRDTIPPEITDVPADIAKEATSSNGAAVTYDNPTAQDTVNGSVTVSCVAPSGSTFALGTTTVTCSASDLAGNIATKFFKVTVQDKTAPTISNTPPNITTEATSAAGAAVTYTNPTATDAVDNEPTISCTPASGSTFALGTATVTCTAQDDAGNSSMSTFTVTVQDTTAPAITAPDEVIAEATAADGATVDFVTSATDAVTPTVAVTCTPASGHEVRSRLNASHLLGD
jgi:hypothetical protein